MAFNALQVVTSTAHIYHNTEPHIFWMRLIHFSYNLGASSGEGGDGVVLVNFAIGAWWGNLVVFLDGDAQIGAAIY